MPLYYNVVSPRGGSHAQEPTHKPPPGSIRAAGSAGAGKTPAATHQHPDPDTDQRGDPAGRRARAPGRGVDVWEVIGVFRTCGEARAALARALPPLSRPQLDAAL